jgi:acetylornithine deacetylase/succinyl-diaminopimelate desuccinylase-like protein
MRISLCWAVLVLLVGSEGLGAEQQQGAQVARAYRQANEARILAEFARLLALPNVASDSVNIGRNAAQLAEQLRQHGVTAEIWKLPGAPPAVYGELLVPGATRTLGIYVHYDGQPADPADWRHNPWEPTLYTRALEAGGEMIPMPAPGQRVDPEWRLYARSAGDDKAPLGALFPVLRALREAGLQPTSNLKFFFEGEEEAGSDHLQQYLEQHRQQLDDIDVWLFFDGPVHQSGRPQLVFGVRGVIGLEITVYGATRALHSGHYGNWAPSAPHMLAELLASLKDENGRVLVDGFYNSVAPLGAEERAALAALPRYDAELRRELGLVRTEGQGESLAERLLLPSLNIRGFNAGNTGTQARNVIPNTAVASLDIRLVKGNIPDAMVDLVEAHIQKQGYHVVPNEPDLETRLRFPRIARITREHGYPAARTPMNLPVIQEVVNGMRTVTGDSLLLVPALGGSLPIYLFTDLLDRPAVIVPVANHDNNQHASNENLRLANLWYAIDLYGALLTLAPRPRTVP